MWGFKRTQGFAGTTFADGRIGVLVNGSMMDNDGWRESNAEAHRDSAAEHKNGVAFRGVIRATDTTKISFGADQLYYDYRWAGSLGLGKFNQNWRQTEAGTYGQYINNYETKSIGLQQLIGDTSELKITYARRTTDEVNNGNGGSGGANAVICDDGTAGALKPDKTVKCSAVNNGSRSVTNTVKVADVVLESTNVQFRKEFDVAKSTLYVGADTYNVTTDSETYNNAYNALQAQAGYWSKGILSSAGNVVKENVNTPYVHFEFSPIKKLRFHLGERFDNIHYSTDDRTAANLDTKRKFRDSIMKTGVTYDLTDSHLIWGNWSESFNAPAANTMVTSTRGTETTVGARLNPENSDTFEIGLRGYFDQIGLKYDATLYHTKNKGFVVGRDCTVAERLDHGVTTSGCTINENAGELTARGFESMWSLAVNSWLDIGATYTLSEAYFNKYVTKTFDYSGNSYQAMPRHRLNLRVAVKPAPNWRVELEGDHYSKYYVNNENNAGKYSRPDLFNLRASYRSKDWSFWMHALNITDRKYATRVGYSTIAGVSQLAASAGQGNAGSYTPFTLRAGLSYDF
jgi:outer membrane receptor protein involved in Fe transport